MQLFPGRKNPVPVRNSTKHIATGWQNWQSVKKSGLSLFPVSQALEFINMKAAARCDCFFSGTVYKSEEVCGFSKSMDFTLEVFVLLFYMK